MNLYIVRHGEAAAIGGGVLRDADRILTPRGEEDSRLMGNMLAKLEDELWIILTSPFVRALQSGNIIARAFAEPPSVESTDNLLPGFRHRALLGQLATYETKASVVVVGHQPDLGSFISWLIADSGPASISMPTSAVAFVTLEAPRQRGQGTLRWLLTPDAVRGLARQI